MVSRRQAGKSEPEVEPVSSLGKPACRQCPLPREPRPGSRSFYIEKLMEIPPLPDPNRGLTTLLRVEPKVKFMPTLK